MELTIEECYRDHRVSAFLIDAPHASHTHEKLKIFTALSVKKKRSFDARASNTKVGVCGGNAYTEAASVLAVYTTVTCSISWRPQPSLRELSFVRPGIYLLLSTHHGCHAYTALVLDYVS